GYQGTTKLKARVRSLLKDPVPTVRLRTAQGLLAAKDETAIPALICLLRDPAIDIAWQAEELLRWIAADKSPKITLRKGGRKAVGECTLAWKAWWQDATNILTKAPLGTNRSYPGLMLLCSLDKRRRWKTPNVWLTGFDGVPRASWGHVPNASQLEYVSGGEILVTGASPTADPNTSGWIRKYSLAGRKLWAYNCATVDLA